MSFPASKSSQKNRRGGKSRQVKTIKPQLTSMVDAVVLILIFLLQSFSAEGDIVTVSKLLTLPTSTATKSVKVTVVIAVTQEQVLAENQAVASVSDVLSTDDMLIVGLSDWLQNRRETTEKIGQYSAKTKFTGDITIQADKRIRFRLLKKIMYTCGQQGFNNFQFAVTKKDG